MRLTEEQWQELQAKMGKKTQPISEPAKDLGNRWAEKKESKLERRFAQQLEEAGLQAQRNYFFLQHRDLELDFAFPAERVAVEVQGMAHRIKGKFKRDIEKRALAMLAGWRVLELDGDAVRSGRGLDWLKQLLGK